MLFVLSPAKNLNEKDPAPVTEYTQPALLAEAGKLMAEVRLLAPQQIAELMHVSDKIALLNAERNAAWHTPFTPQNAKQAVYMFNGDVYEGLDASSLDNQSVAYLQSRVRLLSGLYGLLRPLDLMQPYRLEMGTPFANSRGKNLYEFWGGRITGLLNQTLEESGGNTLVNLASQEYFKAVDTAKLNARLITPVFKDEKNGQYKIISFYAKRARGLMVRYAAKHRITEPEALKNFDYEGYAFNAAASGENEWIFLRKEQYK
ncbi:MULTISPECIES: peroxide stress protein YaaA [unclassified Neisseria]|uniref:peroxide stress protein YaaA n=1 Tax=unclassified Neisseria TaxID=2623750 RepID=UPI0010729DCD|nr:MULTISPECIES: peroxide stress protein YaaA [unclassified Neisseria]MBF0804777.1 peroxide stress protein YaaA [Neisseria sp. 19428wB4_WF04]TFU39534.1 peroxide stress protein YaaA [Neisseria sp. WF04]